MTSTAPLRRRARLAATAILAGTVLSIAASPGPAAAESSGNAGAVYVMTNEPSGNRILVYERATDGTLGAPVSVPTGGRGSGNFEMSGNGLILTGLGREASPNNLNGGHRFLIATNTSSGDVSVFRVRPQGLVLVDVESSGGTFPTSVTHHSGVLYVMNAGGTSCMGGVPNITGFRLDTRGELTPIPGSTRTISNGTLSGCAQVSFNPKGDTLVVTERGSDAISTYTVDRDGLATGPIQNQTTGNGPFAFTFTQTGKLLTAENFQGLAGQGGAAAYEIVDGTLASIGPTARNFRSDTCWIVITDSQRYAYTTNAQTGDISSYTVDPDGTLTLLEPVAATIGLVAADLAFSQNSRYLYARSFVNGTLSSFRVENDGSLTPIETITGIPPGAIGISAR